MSDWRECRVVRDKDGGMWVGNGGAWISWEEPEAVSDDWLRRYYGPLTPVLDADGHPVPELLADVWDEGFDAGDRTARAVNDEWPKRARNPYRQATA